MVVPPTPSLEPELPSSSSSSLPELSPVPVLIPETSLSSFASTRQSQRLLERQPSHQIPETPLALTSQPPATCLHCGLQGHSRTISKHCLKNPKYLRDNSQPTEASLHKLSDLDIDMDDELPDTQLPPLSVPVDSLELSLVFTLPSQ